MPARRSFSSLSFAEPGQRPLQGWVDRSIAESLSEARRRGARLFHVRTTRVDWGLPLGVFESSVSDVHFFGGRDHAILGVGVAKVLEEGTMNPGTGRRMRELLERDHLATADASKVVVVGGWGFPCGRRPREEGVWSDFPASRWVVPALTLASKEGETHLVLAASVGPSSRAGPMRALYRRLAGELELQARKPQVSALPELKSARDTPSRSKWESLAREAIASISSDELNKVVLARAVSLTFRGGVSPSAVLERLIAFNPDSTVFAIKRRRSVFLGATPEGLVSVKRGEATVDCLAASTPRSDDEAADEVLGTRLLEDAKSSREHQFVVGAAVGSLSPISSRVEVPSAPVLRKLTAIQHLYTPVRATLHQGQDLWGAALALWPNPAIGGEPKERAVRWIRRFEKLNRGWYSGVVGHSNARFDEADLYVGIRSGIIRGRRAVIYAGAGLVAGSEPREEFEETSWKLRTMTRALGVPPAGGV